MAIVEPELLTDDIIETYQSNITAIKHQLGTLADLVWNEEEAKCPNCYYDSVNKASTNRYKPAGPIAFSGGRTCPYCLGKGMLTTTGKLSIKGNIFYPGLFTHDREPMQGGVFDNQSANISFLKSECYVNSGTFSGKVVFDVMRYMEFDEQKWILDGMPMWTGLGERFVIEVKVKRTNKV